MHSTGEPNRTGIPTAETRSAPLTTTKAPEASPDHAQELFREVVVPRHRAPADLYVRSYSQDQQRLRKPP
jgi:hypothetical protein